MSYGTTELKRPRMPGVPESGREARPAQQTRAQFTARNGLPNTAARYMQCYEEGVMQIGSVFDNNRTQAVRLPADTRFPNNVKRVAVRVVGESRIIAPIHKTWDDFFDGTDEGVTDDFMAERASQEQRDRESL